MLAWGGFLPPGRGGEGQPAFNASLPPQATNTRTKNRGSQKGECALLAVLGGQALPTRCPNLHPPRSRKDVNVAEFAVVAGDQAFYRSEDIQLGEGPEDTKAGSEAARPGLGEPHLRGPHPALPMPQITKTTS